jgi:hypothetical protein
MAAIGAEESLWVGVIINRAAEKLGEGRRLVIGKIEHHNSP